MLSLFDSTSETNSIAGESIISSGQSKLNLLRMAKIIASNNQAIVDHQVVQEQQHDQQQQQQSSKVLQSTKSQNKINNTNEKDNNNKISERGEDIENCDTNGIAGGNKNRSSSSSDNENNVNLEKTSDVATTTTTTAATTTAAGGNKKLCVVIPPNHKTLLTPTIVTNEHCATPSHLLTSLIQLNGQDVGLFTGLPSCTPTSADSLSASNLGGINPFFWGVSSFNQQDANNNNGNHETTTLSNDFNQRISNNKQTIDGAELKVFDENVSKQAPRNHQTPSKLSLDQIQAANAILSPLSLFLSPEGLRFVDANQHPLAGLSGINHELSGGHNLSAAQNDLNLSNNYHNQATVAAAAAAAAAATCVAAQDLTSNNASESHQQAASCPISSSASSILQARPTITTVHQYSSQQQQQQQQQQAVNQISQSIYSQNQHQLDQTTTTIAPSNTHQLSPRALSQHNQLIYHQQHSIVTPNEEVSVENHLHHIVQQQQQQQQQQQHVVYAQTQPIVSLQCKTLERQPAFGPPAAHHHHHHQIQNIHHPQQQPQQQVQLKPQQLFAVSDQQAVSRQIEYQNQNQSQHQNHNHHHQLQQQHIERARQSSAFSCEQTSQTTIGLYDPHFRNIYLAQQQHSFNGQQGYQTQAVGCIQHQDHNCGSMATLASEKQPEPLSADTARVISQAKDDLAAAPKRTPPLNGKYKQDKAIVSPAETKTSEAPKNTNKHSKSESQSKVKRPNKTKVTTIELAPTTTTVPTNGVINNGEVLVKKKSKGGRKKKIVTHDELMARKNRSKERNRVAAKRCRLKRKQFLDELCGRIDNLNDLNKKLQKENSLLKGELDILKQHHKTCKV